MLRDAALLHLNLQLYLLDHGNQLIECWRL